MYYHSCEAGGLSRESSATDERLKIELLNFSFGLRRLHHPQFAFNLFQCKNNKRKIPTQSYTLHPKWANWYRQYRNRTDDRSIENPNRCGVKTIVFVYYYMRLLVLLFFLHLRCISVVGRAPSFGRLVVANKFWCEFIFLQLWVPFCFEFVWWRVACALGVQCALRSTGLARFRWNGISHGMHVYGVSMRAMRVHQRQNQVKSLWLINGRKIHDECKKNRILRRQRSRVRLELVLLLLFGCFFSVGRKQSYLSMFDWFVSAVFSHFHYTRGE